MTFPKLHPAGIDGLLIRFADTLSEAANRAALAFRARLAQEAWPEIEETSASLVSVLIRFDPMQSGPDNLKERVQALLGTVDWYAADLPAGRRLWRIPCVFGGDLAPQLEEAAALANMTPKAAIENIAATRLRVQTIGFAPGQPYLGTLDTSWDIPRQTHLTAQVPVGAIAVAIRQLVMFPIASPTGWRHIAQTTFRSFRPDSEQPFLLRPGDDILYVPVSAERLDALKTAEHGGATMEEIA